MLQRFSQPASMEEDKGRQVKACMTVGAKKSPVKTPSGNLLLLLVVPPSSCV